MGVVVVALACAVVVPVPAQAATVPWSSQKPTNAIGCGPQRSIGIGYGYVNIRDCVQHARSASGTHYYQGVLEVEYHRVTGGVGDVLGGESMIARVGNPHAVGVNFCPRERWTNSQTRWCYSPTKTFPRGTKIYGKGVLLNSAGGWIQPPVWSRVVTTA